MREIAGGSNAFYGPEVLVALEHVQRVCGKLSQLGVAFEEGARSRALGLAQVRLAEEAQAAHTVEKALGDLSRGKGLEAASARRSLESGPKRFTTDLDRFLWALRAHFAAEHERWTPTIGKNRLLGNVVGGGKVSHGGGPGPQLASPSAPRRAAGPGEGVRVGVLDTSLAAHDWLSGGWTGRTEDVLRNRDRFHAVAGHATFVSGLVLAQAPGCTVQVRRVLSDDDGEADSWTVATRIVELGRSGVDVLNLSMVCYTEDGQPPLALATAIDRLDPDTVVVAAAGNHGDLKSEADRRAAAWPAALDDVVAVGAADRNGTRAALTPQGAPWIDILTTGTELVSTFLTGEVDVDLTARKRRLEKFKGFARWDGTSFAAALLSGAIAAEMSWTQESAPHAWRALAERAVPSNGDDPPFLALEGL
ncbi:S8 family peptidase [Geodermatophilus sp. SYSU D00691]